MDFNSRRSGSTESQSENSTLFPSFRLEEKPLWAQLYESIRDAIFPVSLPPLELTSTPLPVPDRLAARTNPWAVGTAALLNGAILLLVVFLGLRTAANHLSAPAAHALSNLSDLHLFAPLTARPASGGGGGGANEIANPMEGRPPRVAQVPITPPQVPLIDHPKLAVDSAIVVPPDVKLPENSAMPNIGVSRSDNVTVVMNGQGLHGGMGGGSKDGLGPGSGPGYGPGSQGGFGDGVYVPGGSVSKPVLIFAPEAEFSDEARRQKYQGVCMVSLIVDAHGNPQNIHVVRTLGMGLDEKAVEAIRRYRFKPAVKDGRPVATFITVEVDFRLF
jgi:periplasmic protein TonB